MEYLTKNLSFLIIENSDDYILSYRYMFRYYCPSSKVTIIKTLSELQNILLSNNHFDFIISETLFNGFDWKDIIIIFEKTNNNKKKIIFTSAFNELNSSIRELIDNRYTFLEKPFNFKALKKIIEIKLLEKINTIDRECVSFESKSS